MGCRAVDKRWVMNELAETEVAVDFQVRLRIRSPDVLQFVDKLSGATSKRSCWPNGCFPIPRC